MARIGMARIGMGLIGLGATCGTDMGRVIADVAESDGVIRIQAILDRTANAVLSWMEEDGLDLADAVDRAIREGDAAADPRRALDGRDAAATLALLSRIAWGIDRVEDDVLRLGLDGLTAADVAAERARGSRYRLIAQATRDCASVELRRVGPGHPLHGVAGADLAVAVHTRRGGLLTFTGPGPVDGGAGARPGAVITDLSSPRLAPSVARHDSLDAHMTRDGASV